jgi:excisionase family DNA binding protein
MKHSAPDVAVEKLIDAAVAEAVKKAGLRGPKIVAFPKLAYTMREAALATGFSRSGLYLAIKKGELTVVRKGSRVAILHEALIAWLKGEFLPPAP